MNKNICILSGISASVCERVKRKFSRTNFITAFVGHNSFFDDDYFNRLLARTLEILKEADQEETVTRLALFSGISEQSVQQIEKSCFFPAVCRFEVNPAFALDQNQAEHFADFVVNSFKEPSLIRMQKIVRKRSEKRFLLPVRNSKVGFVERCFEKVYNLDDVELSRRILRDAVLLKKSSKIRIKDLDFDGVINNGQHPIRRHSDSIVCDFKAALRFGAVVPERFEFDVSSIKGLKGKEFYSCDGEMLQIKANTTHLNMRINDDFENG